MKIQFIALFILVFIANYSKSQNNLYLSVWFPQNSGLAFVDYEIFEVRNDKLYVIKRTHNPGLSLLVGDTTIQKDPYLYDTLKTYTITNSEQEKLAYLITNTDTLGHHAARDCSFTQGWPRFLIYCTYNTKGMSGYIANCYREHIFKFIDFLNGIYPEGSILKYDKINLWELEKDCQKRDR